MATTRRRLLLLLKPLDKLPAHGSVSTNPRSVQLLQYMDSRSKVHNEAVNFCQEILRKKSVDWEPMLRDNLSQPIRNVDLVVAIGGDGTLLRASHFIDDTIPLLGVNSDPTKPEEVEQYKNDFDATRSAGYLCAATVDNFEKVLDDILEGRSIPSRLSRIAVTLNSQLLPTYALNDILIAHPCPATVSRFSFKIRRNMHPCSPVVNCRSSGLRISTAAGSTAAMLSAGGFVMPIWSPNLQYMVREPMSPGEDASLMHGSISSDQSMDVVWASDDGMIYIDGSHVSRSVQPGDVIEVSSRAPILNVFLPHQTLSPSSKCAKTKSCM